MKITSIAATALLCAATAAILPLAIVAWQARADLRSAIAGLRLIADRGAALVGEVQPGAEGKPGTVAQLVATADRTVAAGRPVLEESEATVRAARKPLSEAAETIAAARPVLSAARGALDAIPPAVASAAGAVVELQGNIAPVLKNANDSWNDLYWDVKAGIESGTVAARGIAEASEAVGKAAPGITSSADKFLFHFAGVTADVHTVTSKFIQPRSWKSKLWDGLTTGARIGALAAR